MTAMSSHVYKRENVQVGREITPLLIDRQAT